MTFDKKIVIQKLDDNITTDDVGNPIENFVDLFNLYASVNGLFGSEYWAASTSNQQNTIDFTIRWFKALDDLIFDKDITKYRIKFKGHYFAIKSFDNIGFKNLFVKIRGVSNG